MPKIATMIATTGTATPMPILAPLDSPPPPPLSSGSGAGRVLVGVSEVIGRVVGSDLEIVVTGGGYSEVVDVAIKRIIGTEM